VNRAVLIIGAGGHGKVVADALLALGCEILGFADVDRQRWGERVLGKAVLGGDDVLDGRDPASVWLANGVGSTGSTDVRRDLYSRLRGRGYSFATIVHPRATVAGSASLGMGAQIMAGAVVQADARIGDNVIVNTGALIDHDCKIGAHTHIAPGCVLSGMTVVGDECHIGVGAVIRQGVTLGARTVVGAGAVVVADFDGRGTLAGIPAKVLR
jgi:UDP-perosamine 4-acetyltransferase